MGNETSGGNINEPKADTHTPLDFYYSLVMVKAAELTTCTVFY